MYDDIEYLSIPQIAVEVGGSDNLVRRYSQRFPEFFTGRVVDGVMKYPPSTVEMVEHIKALYEKGKSRSEIRDILYTQYHPTIDLQKPGTRPDTIDTMPTPRRDPVADIQKVIAGAITEAVQSISDQKAEITELRSRLAELEAKMEKMSKNGNPERKSRSWIDKLFGLNKEPEDQSERWEPTGQRRQEFPESVRNSKDLPWDMKKRQNEG